MNDRFWMFPVFCGVLFFSILFIMVGGELEKNRIYDKCMNDNKTMIHEDAVKHCKNVVR